MKRKHLWKQMDKLLQIDTQHFFRGGFWLTVGQAASALSALAVSVVLARLLSKEQFGEYQFIMTLIGTLAILTFPGFNVAALQGWSKGYRKTVLYAIKMRFFLGFTGLLALLIFSAYLYFIRTQQSWWTYIIFAIIFPFIAAGEPLLIPLLAQEKFRALCKRQVISALMPAVLTIIVCISTRSLFLSALAFLGSQIAVYGTYFMLDYSRISKGKIDPTAKHFGTHLSFLNILSYLQVYYDKLLVTYFFGFLSIAVYSISSAIADQLYALSKMLVTLIYPRLLKFEAKEAFTAIRKHIPHLALLFTGLAGIGILLTPPFINIVYTSKYAEAIKIAQGLLVVGIVRSLGYILFRTLEARRKTKQLYFINTSYFAVELIFTLILLPRIGLLGVVIAQGISNLWFLGTTLYFITKNRTLSQ